MKRIINIIVSLFVVVLASQPLYAQGFTVKGSVKDAKTGEALIGVSIVVKGGKAVGTMTDLDGNYTLKAPNPESTIVVSYVGYKTQEIPISGKSVVDIKMEDAAVLVDEVVVIGYGVQKKESVVGAISSINNKTLVSAPVTNLTQSLAGKMSGIQVVQSSGEVGRDEAEIYIRGMATYGDATPLIVVDGIVRNSFAQIDPNEVLSINILKDASATAVYGIKGANGVIVVTTRRGKEGKPQVSASAQIAVTQPTRIPTSLPAYESSLLYNLQNLGMMKESTYKALDVVMYKTHASPYTHPDEILIDRYMKDFSLQQQYNVNVTGGTDKVKYFVSTGAMMQDGFYNFDDITCFNRYNFRTNLDFNITNRLTAQVNIGSRIEQRNDPQGTMWNSWNVYHDAFAGSGRKYPFYNPDGSLSPASNIVGILSQSGIAKRTKSVLESGVVLRYDLGDWLKGVTLRGQVSYDNQGENTRVWTQSYDMYEYNFDRDQYTQKSVATSLDWAWESSTSDQRLYYEVGAEYNNEFGKHSLSGLFLANRNLRLLDTEFEFAEEGLVGRLAYNYDRRYFVEANVGINGSENFAKGSRYGVFPAFAAGWTISNEGFYQASALSNILSLLKIRASLGWVGNDKYKYGSDDSTYARFIYLQKYNYESSGPVFGEGDNSVEVIRRDKLANSDVTWEVARKTNIGLETDFFDGLFGLTFDLFHEYRTNILTDISGIIPGYVGTEVMPANVGIVENKGFEIELRHNYSVNKDFNYYVKGNFTFNRNKVIKKADPLGLLPYQKEEGYPINTPLLYNTIGVFQDYEDIYNSPSQLTMQDNIEVLPGDLKYLDFNGDGIITEDDAYRQLYGSVPEIQYGVTVGASYKNFDMSVLVQGSAHASFEKNWEIIWPFNNHENAFERHWYWWSPELSADDIQHCRFHGRNYRNNQPVYGTTYSTGSGDYVRIKSVELGYSLPEAWMKKIGIGGIRLYFTSNNLFTWAAEKYIDPDNRNNRGGYMPQTRAFNFGVNINF